MYGLLTLPMQGAIRPYVDGKYVQDLGAGDLAYSKLLVDLGARHVLAIDKAKTPRPPAGVTVKNGYFHEIEPLACDVAFVSWPSNYDTQIECLLEKASTIIYLGTNVSPSACGSLGLFNVLLHRPLLGYMSHPSNSLIIVGGDPLPKPREPTPEELSFLRYCSAGR